MNNVNIKLFFILGMSFQIFLDLIIDLIVEPIRKKWRKECNYDCSKCKVWDCDKHLCDHKRKKEEEKRKVLKINE